VAKLTSTEQKDLDDSAAPSSSISLLSVVTVWAIFAFFIFGILVATGILFAGPRVIDDNQIYKLQIEFKESGFVQVLKDELESRFGMSRLVPLHCIHKIFQAKLFGGNMLLWSIWNGFHASMAALLLFLFMRLCRYSNIEAFAFSFLIVLGQQSVLWWRLFHGEGIGLFFLAAGLVLMAQRIRTGKLGYEWGFALLTTIALFSKESYILVIPGVLLLKIGLTCRLQEVSFRAAFKQSLPSILWLGLTGFAMLIVIKFVLGTTHFTYTGWDGFHADQFRNTLLQYFKVSHIWLVGGLAVLLVILKLRRIESPSPDDSKNRKRNKKRNRRKRSKSRQQGLPIFLSPIGFPLSFWILITLPQLLLYMKSGILNNGNGYGFSRYLVPCMLGCAFLVAELLRLVRESRPSPRVLYRIAIVLVFISCGLKSLTAYHEARAFSVRSLVIDDFFLAITKYTEPDSPIIISYNNGLANGYQTQVALRLYYILSERHQRTNLYFLPTPDRPTIEESRLLAVQKDTRHHGLKLRHASQLDAKTPADVLVILNTGQRREWPGPVSTLLEQMILKALPGSLGERFNVENYQRMMEPMGNILYFRKE